MTKPTSTRGGARPNSGRKADGKIRKTIGFKVPIEWHEPIRTVVKAKIAELKLLPVLILGLFVSCSSGPVLMQTKKHTYFKGNYKHFQQRKYYDSLRKVKRLEKLTNFKKLNDE